MGYNFNCAPGCTLPNEHFGPCDALTEAEQMARAILGAYRHGESYCLFCVGEMEDGSTFLHDQSCVAIIAGAIWTRRERNLRAIGRTGTR